MGADQPLKQGSPRSAAPPPQHVDAGRIIAKPAGEDSMADILMASAQEA